MTRSLLVALGGLAGLVTSCDPVLPQVERPPTVDSSEVRLEVDPDDRGAAIVRLALVGEAASAFAPADVWLVEGVVPEASLGRWADGDPPQTLLARVVPTTNFVADDGKLELIPHAPLGLALEHSVLARGEAAAAGLAFTFWTAESSAPHAVRVWPPADAFIDDVAVTVEVESAHAVYCGLTPTTFDDDGAAVGLEPWGPQGTFSVLGDRCVVFEPAADAEMQSGLFHAPRTWGGVDLDPAPIRVGEVLEAERPPLVCTPAEVPMGPLCALVQDDRVQLRAAAARAFYAVSAPSALALHVGNADAESSFELRGLTPDTPFDVTVRWIAPDGTDQVLAMMRTTLPQPHIDIAEVMADPTGAEPEQEWVELHNDGLGPVELAGFFLADAAGEVELTPFVLGAGERVLLVREGFIDGALDASRILVLPRLGGNGLSNAGEALELRDALGQRLSTFPAAPKPKPGISTSLMIDASGARSWVHTEPTPLAAAAEVQSTK